MDEFVVIEAGFNNADETINFGTRSIGYDSLYEVSTIACLKCSEESSGVEEVFINSFVRGGKFFLAVNNSLKVFENTELSSIIFSVMFDCIIDTICISPNGKYLLLCLRSGMVHVFDMESTVDKNCIFSKCFNKNTFPDSLYLSSFVEQFTNKEIIFILVSTKGNIYRVSITLNNDRDGNNIVVNMVEIYHFCNEINKASFSYPNLLVYTNEISILNVDNMMVVSADICKLKMIYNFGHKFLALDEYGHLLRICSLTLMIFFVEDTPFFEDVLVLNDTNDNKQIVAVTKKNEIGESFLQLFDSDFSVIFSLKISHPVHLIQLDNISDETLILSKISNNSGLVIELRVQCINETEPEMRLNRLIRKQKFDEAEQFVKIYNMNPVVILKAKAQLIVDKTVCSSEDIMKLIALLDLIDDDHFKLQCCSNVECNNYEDVRKILNYGSMIVPKSRCENREAVLLLQRILMDLLFKFDTYMAVNSYYELQTWTKFSICDLIEELKIYLKNFQIEEAIIIYSRLDLLTVNTLTDEKVEGILSLLNNLPTAIYKPFLLTFIPVTMACKPSALLLFVKWLKTKIFHLEKKDNLGFPENGLKFAEFILKLLKVENNGSVLFQRQCTLNKDVLSDLANLMDALKCLQLLKNNFKISVSLSDYLMGPKKVIRILMNVSIPPEEYNIFLKDFLYKFMIQNQFDPDDIFLNEIKNLIKYDEEYWVEIVGIILNYISSIKIKLEAVKEILENAHVPWCDTLRRIGQNALQYSHPLVTEIKNILKNEVRLVVLRNPKYNIKEKHVSTLNELQYIVKRIMYINEPSMVNDVFQLCTSQRERHEVNILLVQHFINKKDYENAMSVLDNIENTEEMVLCARWIASYAEIIINNEVSLNKYVEIYYDILGPLFRRLIENSDTIDKSIFEENLQILRGVFNLNRLYNRNIKTHDLRSITKKNTIFKELIEDAAKNFSKGSLKVESVFDMCNKLATYLSLEEDVVLIKFCKEICNYDVVLKAAEYLYESDSSSRNLCFMAVLLLKCMGLNDSQTQTLFDSFCDNSDGYAHPSHPDSRAVLSVETSSNTSIFGLKLSENLIQKALINAEEHELLQVAEVMSWINSCFYLIRSQENVLEKELFKSTLYHSTNTLPGYASIVGIKSIFEMYCNFMGKYKNTGTPLEYLTYLMDDTTSTEEQLLQELRLLPQIVDDICREGQHLTAYNLLVSLKNGLRYKVDVNPAIYQLLNSVINKNCLPQLFHAIVSFDNIDELMVTNLLIWSSEHYVKYIDHYLKVYKRQPRKLHAIASVGIQILDFHKISTDKLVKIVITCKWWNKLKSTVDNILPYDVFFKTSANIRLKQLLDSNLLNLLMIQEYCEDFNLNVQNFYMEYLKSTLVNWKPEYECKTDMNGKKSLILKSDENQLQTKCEKVIELITDKEGICFLMDKIWNMANVYHYEVFICILKILKRTSKSEKIKNEDLLMLLFLKDYQRCSVPSQNEKEQWYTSFPDSQVLDPLSEFRLPFSQTLFTHDIWDIIRSEINLKTYKCWFDALNILSKNLKKDDICIYAVKNVVTSEIFEEESSGGWILYPKFENLFVEVDECVQHISELERATSVVYYLMYHIPNGADKVNAAQLSYKYAQKYKEENPNSSDVEKAYIKVKTKYYSFSAMHILHTFQLADDKYLQLVAQPDELIDALYQDERIIEQAECINLGCPDINKAVDAIGELYNLKVHRVRYRLVHQYLCNTNNYSEFDSTVSLDLSKLQSNTDNDLKRTTYICSNDKKFWQNSLLKIGINEDSDVSGPEQKSLSFRARALKCFCAISDVDSITELTEVSYKEFLNYTDKLSLLSELECLGIVLEVEALDQYNKKELLKRVSQVGKPMAVKVMAAICITYFMKDARYWEFIINNTIKFGLLTELKTYVHFLKDQCYTRFYINAWQVIIDNAFDLPQPLSNEKLHQIYLNNFLMIQSCPVLYSLSFENIVRKCIQAGKFEFATVLLQYLPEEKRNTYIQMLSFSKTIFLDLDNLSNNGIWGIRKTKTWLAQRLG